MEGEGGVEYEGKEGEYKDIEGRRRPPHKGKVVGSDREQGKGS